MTSHFRFQSKLPGVANSIFSRMSALAQRYDAINLSQGFPDFECSPRLVELVGKYMRSGYNQYAPMAGVPLLRERIAGKIAAAFRLGVDPGDEITVTAGATQALFTAIAALINAGDEAIIFEPAYDSYAPAVRLFGGVVRNIPTYAPAFQIDWESVRRVTTAKTKLIIINSPGNPSSKLFKAEDFDALAELIKDTGILVLSDEVYADVVYDDNQRFVSALEHPLLRERSLVVSSFGKLFHITGWKVGYIVAPPWLTDEFRKVHQFNVFSVNTPIQYALAEFLENQAGYEGLATFFKGKRDILLAALSETRFAPLPCAGSYFQLINYAALSTERDDMFCERLTRDFGLATIPVSAFYSANTDQHLLRVCFAKSEDTLAAAAIKLREIDQYYG